MIPLRAMLCDKAAKSFHQNSIGRTAAAEEANRASFHELEHTTNNRGERCKHEVGRSVCSEGTVR